MTFLDLSNQYRPAWHHRVEFVSITSPGNILVGYRPEVQGWAHGAGADSYMPDEAYVWAAEVARSSVRGAARISTAALRSLPVHVATVATAQEGKDRDHRARYGEK